MLLRDFILISGVGQVHSGLVEFFTRHRSLLKEFLPAVEDFLLRGKEFFRSLRIELSFLNFLGQVGDGSGFVDGLGLVIRAFVLLGCGCEVAVLKHRQQLAFVYAAATFDIESLDGSADFWSNGRLLQGKQDGFSGDRVLNCLLLNGDHLHRNGRFLLGGILGAAE